MQGSNNICHKNETMLYFHLAEKKKKEDTIHGYPLQTHCTSSGALVIFHQGSVVV